MRFGVLGPLAVWRDDGESVHVPEAKVRALLADLLAHGGRPVSADRLVEDLWGGRPPRNATGTLQARVSQLRKALGDPALVLHSPGGYRLVAEDVDAVRFESLVERRTAEPRVRAGELDEALALWRGPAYADVADLGFAQPVINRLEELRLSAQEELAEVRLELGEPVDVSALVREHPLRERLRAVHITSLYRAGRQNEALASYTELRARLSDELGLDPSPELAALYERLLRQDPALAPPPVSHLPAALTPLVGRDAELAEVGALVGRDRLVTLTGPGGVGKTSLALEAARGLLSARAFPDGVALVELAGATRPVDAVAAAVCVRDDSSAPLEPRVAQALSGTRALLVLDNCEHLVEPVATLVAALLRSAPGLRVLATSQEPLGVTGERVHQVPPLAEPDAVRLLSDRAGVAEGEAVRTICRRLDGIPLALELAATRVRALGAEELAGRLDDRFRVLTSGMRDAPARQRTLRAMIDWSWELLGEPERLVLRRLAVHADGCDLEAAEAVCAEPGVDVLESLARLVDRSLVAPGPRYRLLESVAAYGLERLREAGEYDLVRARHTGHYTGLAERAALHGPDQLAWLDRLDQESANLELALTGPAPLRLANALAWYWFLRGRLGAARRSLAQAITYGGAPAEVALARTWLAGFTMMVGEPRGEIPRADLDLRGRAVADWFLSFVHWAYGDLAAHDDAVERALAAFGELGDRWGSAAALVLRAKLAVGRGDLDAMRRDGEAGLAAFRELGDRWGRIEAMEALAMRAEIRGDYPTATRLRETELLLSEELGFPGAAELSKLGRMALLAGDHARADDYHERARRIAVEQSLKSEEEHAVLGLALGARRQGRYEEAEALLEPWLGWLEQVSGTSGIAFALAETGFAAEQRGDAGTALARQRRGYAAARETGDPRAVALALEGLAGALSLAGEHERAAGHLGAAAAVRASVGAPLPPAESFDVERITARLAAAMMPGDYALAYRSGQRELGDHVPAALRVGPGEQPAAEGLDPFGHADQAEPAAEPRRPGI
ncbi:BTAD domain-containing putative transcriptional regulator [Nonomuraea longicatena]|uniref:BTAD domain-containing putative transcriptional regulator n=1 Tax=Nonomuraea longicatena TaxID=83682 RepID=UPI0031E108A2